MTFETRVRIDTLKEIQFWHGTFNINAAINSSKTEYKLIVAMICPADITGVTDAKFGLKYKTEHPVQNNKLRVFFNVWRNINHKVGKKV